MIRIFAAAAVALAMASGSAQALSLSGLVPGYSPLPLPDIQSNVDGVDVVAQADLTDVGGGRVRLTASVSSYDSLFAPFYYTPASGAPIELEDAQFALDVEFDRLGEGYTQLGNNLSGSTNSFSIGGLPQTTPSNWTGAIGEPILTGVLLAAGTQENQISLLWEVTGGRAAAAYGGHAVTFLSNSAIAYNALTGVSPFSLDRYTMDTKPAAVPVPAALPLAAMGVAALAGMGLRRRRR